MALPQNAKVAKTFNQKHKSKFDDDHNFQVIIAPGAVKRARWGLIHGFTTFSSDFVSVVALAQFFGLFPFVGVFARKHSDVRFKWTSFRVAHASLWIASVLVFIYVEFLSLSRQGTLNAKNISWVYRTFSMSHISIKYLFHPPRRDHLLYHSNHDRNFVS